MFERFTDPARRVITVAQEEARLLNHNYIGTEHLLLGLVGIERSMAARVLAELGLGLDAVRADVIDIIGPGGDSPSGHIPFTPRAKKVLELSLREALQLGHNYIGTEHILLGIIREGEGVAAHVLVTRGHDHSTVRERVLSELSGGEPEPMGSDDDDNVLTARRVPLGRTTSSAPFTHGPPVRAEGPTPGLLAVVFVLIGVAAAAVERPPTALGRVGLGTLLAGLVAALTAATIQPGFLPGRSRWPGGGRPTMRTALPTAAFAGAVLVFGVASGILVLDALLS